MVGDWLGCILRVIQDEAIRSMGRVFERQQLPIRDHTRSYTDSEQVRREIG